MKQHKNKIIFVAVAIALLTVVFWYGGNAPGLRGWPAQTENSVNTVTEVAPIKTELPSAVNEMTDAPAPTEEEIKEEGEPLPVQEQTELKANKPQNVDGTPMTPDEKEALAEHIAEEKNAVEAEKGSKEYSAEAGMEIDGSTGKDKYLTDPIPVGMPLPVEPQDAVISDKELTCTLSVRCDTILNNIEWLDSEKVDIIPKDGVIFAERTVTFYEGESVCNLLVREMKRNKIHMEFENTPIYNSAYIEGIANLYEFDCGELSGWMYKVNDWFPNYGCSRYRLEAGDRVEWVYTCDLGVDVGGYYAAKGE